MYIIENQLMDPEYLPPVFPSAEGYFDVTLMTKNGNQVQPLLEFITYVETHPINLLEYRRQSKEAFIYDVTQGLGGGMVFFVRRWGV